MIIYIGHDPKGVKRVFGIGSTHEIAEQRAIDATFEYIKHRPDTGPLSEWKFSIELTRKGTQHGRQY